jgi:hypothetical protein
VTTGSARPGIGIESRRRTPTARRRSLWNPLLLFTLVLLVHGLSRVSQSYDSLWSVQTALSIMKHGNTDLDEYRDDVLRGERYLYDIINGHIYSSYPIGTPLLAAPFVYLADGGIRLFCSISPEGEELLRRLHKKPVERVDAVSFHRQVEVFVASLIVALTTVLVYYIGRRCLSSLLSLGIAGLFAFCTSAWSTASRGLWQHGPSMLMLTAALLILLQSSEKPFLAQFASLPLAFSFVVRPTNALSIIALTIYVVLRHRRYLLQYLAWSLVVVVPFMWYNMWLYHAILPPYFSLHKVGASVHLLEGLAGNLISPSRGLFVFCPVLALSVWGMVLSLKARTGRLLAALLVGVVVLHWFVISSFPDWYAGHTYGPRYFTDVVPLFVYFLIPVLATLSVARGFRKAALGSVLGLLVLASAFTNGNGAVNQAAALWNSSPVDIDEVPGRVWDWTDPQFLRGVVRKDLDIKAPGTQDDDSLRR